MNPSENEDHGISGRLFSENRIFFAVLILLLAGAVLTSLYSFLLFHVIVEMFSVLIAAAIFIIVWNTRGYLQNTYLLIVGIAYLFIGSIDFIHTLAYAGMDIFVGYGPNLPTQLWIIARYMEAATLVVAPLMFSRTMKPYRVLGLYAAATAVLVTAAFVPGLFPACYVEGEGLTLFKIVSEYLICILLACAIYLLWRHRDHFEDDIFWLVVASIVLTICAELSFTFYVSVYGLSNFAGHLFKLASFALIYQALVVSAFRRPYETLFREVRQAEETVRKERDLLQQYLDLAPVMFIVIDRNGEVKLINRRGAEILGYPAEEIIGKNWYATFLPSPVRKTVISRLDHLLADDVHPGDEVAENLILTKDGEYRRILWHNTVIRNADGMITGTLSSGEDVTDIREAERDLHLKNAAIEATQNGIALLSMDGSVRYANAALTKMLGYDDETALVGLSIIDLGEDREQSAAALQNLTETGNWFGEQHGKTADGRTIDLLASATVISDTHGEPMNFVVSFMDITEMHRYRAALREANKKLNILSSMTRHDILNQVQVLLSYSELLEELTPDDAPGHEYIEKLFEATKRIYRQISFTRDYQDLGVKAPRWQKVNAACAEGADAIDPRLIQISCMTGALEIYADTMLVKVFYNLFDNAARHGVSVTDIYVSFTEGADGSGTLLVTDNGVGVPESQKERIFERGVGSNTGLGLFIIREVLGITGCSITEVGTEGEGATFSIHIPAGAWRYGDA
ncbi:PAS domain S-box protein [Methanogenium sp. S4BF]|uniref:MASE3 domain-containing protein n=1 Tax=Methanogenium sp. S4BF TaxID=1789226 RepID=UPI0024175A3E|nr:MASE3 domain-containing protein [Methanogenium sp. S4BF]WFN33971.1 PAS domain S-box protein [Methanogenium sp. S4BF]